MASKQIDEPTSGSVRYKDWLGEWRMASPGDSLYSLALFLGEEWWDGDKWVEVESET